MSRLMTHHEELTNGVGKCSVPMWCSGMPSGFCNEPAYGKRTEEGKARYDGYVTGLACYGHGGPKNIQPREIHVIFSGEMPDLAFVEVETPEGKSISIGRWEKRGEYSHLILGVI